MCVCSTVRSSSVGSSRSTWRVACGFARLSAAAERSYARRSSTRASSRSATGLIVRGLFASPTRPRLVRSDVQHADAPTGGPADCGEGAGISPDINPGAGPEINNIVAIEEQMQALEARGGQQHQIDALEAQLSKLSNLLDSLPRR